MSVAIVQAGGGCRTLWGAGLLEALEGILPPVAERAGVSAGAAMAVVAAAGRTEPVFSLFLERVAANRRNLDLRGRLAGRPLFPHEAIYRDVLRTALAEGGLETLRAGPPVRIGLVSVRLGHPPWRTAWRAFRRFSAVQATDALHGPPAPIDGLAWRVATAQDAPDADTLVDWVVASSASPPVTGVPRIEGRLHLDAGLVENVPVRALSATAQRGPVLVVLARPQAHGPVHEEGHRLYLAPAAWPPIQRWDYTRPNLAQATRDLGRRDGERWALRVRAFFGG